MILPHRTHNAKDICSRTGILGHYVSVIRAEIPGRRHGRRLSTQRVVKSEITLLMMSGTGLRQRGSILGDYG